MTAQKKAIAILVGGGPAPGINGVISSATIEAINRGYKVYGINYGFSQIAMGDSTCIRELSISEVSRIYSLGGSWLGTSRANPTKNKEMLETTVKVLRSFNIGYLVTIGGDDTATSAIAVAKAAGGDIAVAHVPKTIDNDLPLPSTDSTFGFQSARSAGTDIVETLMLDAKTTRRWYLIVTMGRKAGHLALGIGISSGATLTIIPEEFGDGKITIQKITDILVGSILKRMAVDRNYGVAVLAEGLAEKIEESSIPELASVERDPHGHIRYAELDFGRIIKDMVKTRLAELGVKLTIVSKDVGYELRCTSPVPFDREYTRELGFGVIDFILQGGWDAMISRQGDKIVPIPFSELVDPNSGKTRVRLVDVSSSVYKIAKRFMIRLTKEDLENADLFKQMAKHTTKQPAELKAILESAV